MPASVIRPPHRVASSVPWIVTSAVSLLAAHVWGASFSWQLSAISVYTLFPLLGLLGFSIMWSHYMVGEMYRIFHRPVDRTHYFRITGYVVLASILLHRGLLTYQRLRDGHGLPPGS